MANNPFIPSTTVTLCADSGITAEHKAYFNSQAGIIGYLSGKALISRSEYSYQRADDRQFINLDCDYYEALKCDALYWKNAGHSEKYIVGLITEVAFINPNCTRVYFEVDPYSTFCGDITFQACYVEREHVLDDWNAGAPNWENIGPPEAFDGTPCIVTQSYDYKLDPNMFIVLTAYDASGEPNFVGTVQSGIYSGLNMLQFFNSAAVDEYLTTVAKAPNAELNGIAGIISVPSIMTTDEVFTATNIASPWVSEKKYNNAKVYSSQFCMFRMESITGEGKNYLPELVGQEKIGLPVITVNGKANISGGIGGVAFMVNRYKGVDNNLEEAFVVSDIPQGVWVGNNYVDNGIKNSCTQISGALGMFSGIIRGGATGAAVGAAAGPVGASVGGVVGAIAGAASPLISTTAAMADANKQSAKLSGQATANANLACGLGAYRVSFRWYRSTTPVMESADAYFDRFGYRINKIKVPNTHGRPRWNFVKTSEAHIAGDIPANYRQAIENMLNNGVTFWNTANGSIGDFSNPAGNKG